MPVIRPRGLFRIALFALAVSSLAGYGTYLLVLTLLGEGSPLSTVTWDKRGGDVHPFALRKTKHYVEPPEPTGADLAAFDFAKDVAIVYTWVNGSVPEYQAIRRQWGGDGAVGTSRDRENDELRHSLRSYAKHMSWHRGPIILVTPLGMAPTWLNTSHPRVRVVAQETLFPVEEDNPTFNSNALEQHLWRIPGLTDLFVHMNDDYFFGKDVQPWHFFTKEGGMRFFFENNVIHGSAKEAQQFFKNKQRIWLSSVYTTNALFERDFGHAKRFFLKHAPFVYKRESLRRAQEKWAEDFAATSGHKFRHWFDVITPLAHHYYVAHEGSVCCGDRYEFASKAEMDHETGFFILSDDTRPDQAELGRLADKHPRFITVNDNFNRKSVGEIVRDFTDKMFPIPSEFELQPEGAGQARQ